MQDGCRILGNGKSGKMAKKYQHHKFSQAWGKDEENLTHFFRHYQKKLFNSSHTYNTKYVNYGNYKAKQGGNINR